MATDPAKSGDAEMTDKSGTASAALSDDPETALRAMGYETSGLTSDEIRNRIRMLQNNVRIMNGETARLRHQIQEAERRVNDNRDKVKLHKQLPYLVANVVEVIDPPQDDVDESKDESIMDENAQRTSKAVVVKTTSRQTVFLPVSGLVDPEDLRPSCVDYSRQRTREYDLVGVNKDSHLILANLPAEFDSRVKAMEVDEKPSEDYNDVGGLDKQIEELVEAVVMPIMEAERFTKIGIQPPKGVLLYGPPGTGKTLLARACANQTKATFLKLAGPQLVQMFIGDGAKIVRDAFALAKEKTPAIIFIDELDAVGTKRFDSDKSGDREVQRTMLELLNQLDGFSSDTRIKVIAATNRPDILDPALMRSGRIDRKVECPLPNEIARERILKIHAQKMNCHPDVNYKELARCTQDFNGAQLKAVTVEAGMLALRRDGVQLMHEDFMEGISEVQSKKKNDLQYYA